MTNEDQVGINDDRPNSDILDMQPKSYGDQLEVMASSSQNEELDGVQGETSVVKHEIVVTPVVAMPISTSSLAGNAAATLQTLASQGKDVTSHEATTHIHHVDETPYQFLSSSMSEIVHEEIVFQTLPPAEDIIDYLSEDMINDDGMIILSSNHAKEDIDRGETSVVEDDSIMVTEVVTALMSTSTVAADAAAVQASQMNDTTAPESIAHTLHVLGAQNQVISSSVDEAAHEVIVKNQAVHNGEQLFPCVFCKKKFVRKSQCKRHERQHTGECPFMCETCGKGFRFPSNLKDHTYTHTKEKPYPCRICGKGFTQRGSMMRHISAIHDKRKDVKCPHCNKCFNRKDYLKLHIRKCHWHKCPICKNTFELEVVFEQHQKECAMPTITPKSPVKGRAKKKSPSSASGHKRTLDNTPLLTPIPKRVHNSPPVVLPVGKRKISDPAHINQLMSIYEYSVNDSLSDHEFQAEEEVEGKEEEMEVLEEVEEKIEGKVEEQGEVEEIVEEEEMWLHKE